MKYGSSYNTSDNTKRRNNKTENEKQEQQNGAKQQEDRVLAGIMRQHRAERERWRRGPW